MRIVIDAFGGDHAPDEIVKGAALAAEEFGVDITLTGDEQIIRSSIEKQALKFSDSLKIVHTTDVIAMEDEPTSLLRAHKESSMAVAFRELAEGNADALVSAGSTGAMIVGSTFIVKRIKGIKRPALGGLIPSPDGSSYLLLDMGANAECRPEMLCQFGVMASVYMEKVEGRKNPKIGLLNIGTEESKGDTLRQEAYALLKEAPINFIGNVESREMPKGVCDAVVADGFTGNIALKLIEGTSMTLMKMIKQSMYRTLPNKLAALVLKKDLYKIKNTMDSSEVGGAPVLGVQKPVIKAHGSSNARAIRSAVGQAIRFAERNVIATISENL